MSPHNILVKINDKLFVLSYKKYLKSDKQIPAQDSLQDQENKPIVKAP